MSDLSTLEKIRSDYGPGLADRKLALLRRLARQRLGSARAVLRLHEALCFLRAYPDDARVLERVEAMLLAFDRRSDLRRHAGELVNSGVAGTEIAMHFYAQMARWLTERWGERLRVDWDEAEEIERLERLLPLLVLFAESAPMEDLCFSLAEWCEQLAGEGESDAAFLVRRIAALGLDPFVHEWLYQELRLPLVLSPGPDTPSRTRAKLPDARVHYQTSPLDRRRPELPSDALRAPLAVRELSRREGARLIDLAREAMVTRERDLDVFAYGDPDDVRLIEWEDGLQFAAIGAIPERRLLFEAVYGFLTLENGVPIGYVLNSALFGSAEIAYNVFETYRGGEAGRVYGRVLATVHHLFGADSFTVYPYQLGDENLEALRSGAWWFYQKLGFRAKEPEVLAAMERELAAMRRDPEHRTPIETLRALARHNVYWHMGRERRDVIGLLHASDAGLVVARRVAERFGSDREQARAACEREAARALGVRSQAGWTGGERLGWSRWAPLVTSLPGLARWTPDERAALLSVVRAKGGRRESDFVRLFDAHRRLRRAVVALAHEAGQA